MKRIAFLITTYQLVGGHYYSLVTTVKALALKYDVSIINIGLEVSPIIKESGFEYYHIYYNKKNFFEVSKKIYVYITQNKIDVIHAFDYTSCFLASYSVYRNPNVYICYTKCGGPVLKWWQKSNVGNMVLFSKEDVDSCAGEKFSSLNIAYIPNRVWDFDLDKERTLKLKKKYNLEDKRVILRIGRIAEAYMKTTKQSIRLVQNLQKLDSRFALLLIGSVKDDKLKCEIENEIKDIPNVYIESSSEYTAASKELLDVADIVIGTGRGFMEACSKNKIMFVPSDSNLYPIMVDDTNFQKMFYNNFSPRCCDDDLQNISDKILLKKINEYCSDSRKWFDEYFNADAIQEKYSLFYDRMKETRVTLSLIVRYCIVEYGFAYKNFFKKLINYFIAK